MSVGDVYYKVSRDQARGGDVGMTETKRKKHRWFTEEELRRIEELIAELREKCNIIPQAVPATRRDDPDDSEPT